MRDYVAELNDVGFFTLNNFTFPAGLEVFDDLDRVYPNKTFRNNADEFDPKLFGSDEEMLNAMQVFVHAALNKLVPGSVWKFHFVGYGVNDDIIDFHNDCDSAGTCHNLTANLFFDNAQEGDGLFQIKKKDGNTVSTIKHAAGAVIVFNQSRQFLHRVTPSNRIRKVISFAGFCPVLNME